MCYTSRQYPTWYTLQVIDHCSHISLDINNTNNNNNNNNTSTTFMVLSSCLKHCESSLWFTRWVQHGARWPPTFGPSRSAWTKPACRLPAKYTHHRHFIITQPESWYSFYHPTEGRRLSRPSWLATYRDGLPARTRSPIQVLTGHGVE